MAHVSTLTFNMVERYRIFSLHEAKILFDNLTPYIKAYSVFLEVEKIIMNELYMSLEGRYIYQLPTVNEFINSVTLPTDIKRMFLYNFAIIIKNKVTEILRCLMENNEHFLISAPIGGFLISITVCKYQYNEDKGYG